MLLSGGRKLAFDEVGDPNGFPIFYFHGGNGSRLEARWFERQAKNAGLRIIATDRPGFGQSDPDPERTLTSWAKDIAELADHLALNRISVVGLSGGGPHALAVAHELGERVAACAVVSSLAPAGAGVPLSGVFPVVRLLLWSARWFPSLNRFLLRQMQGFYADPEEMRAQMASRLPEPDRKLLLERPEVLEIFAADAKEAHRQGLSADAQEWQLYVQDWGFNLADIRVPVNLWYGRYDVMVPVAMGTYLGEQIPGACLSVVEDGAHFSTVNNHFVAICIALRARAIAPDGA